MDGGSKTQSKRIVICGQENRWKYQSRQIRIIGSPGNVISVILFSCFLYHFLMLFVYALYIVLVGSGTVYCQVIVKYNFITRGIWAYRWKYFRTRRAVYFISKFKSKICYVISYSTFSIFFVYHGENIICLWLTVSTLPSFCLFILYTIFYTLLVYFLYYSISPLHTGASI